MSWQFKLEPTEHAQWLALVAEAQTMSGYDFPDPLENYLVLTLDYFTREHHRLTSSVIAVDLLEGVQLSGSAKSTLLRNVGDQCLLLAGLFPERALRKNVSLDYFINMGKQAYTLLAEVNSAPHIDQELFSELSHNFVGLMDVLHTIRQIPLKCL